MKHNTRIILRVFSTGLVCISILLAFLISAIRLFGFEVCSLHAHSMEPAYPAGSMLYVQRVTPPQLRVRDVITFKTSPTRITTRRIVEIVEENGRLCFRTKGDASAEPDAALVEAGSVIGRVAFSIPLLGYITGWVQSPAGICVCIAASILMTALTFGTENSGKKQKTTLTARSQDKPAAPQTQPSRIPSRRPEQPYERYQLPCAGHQPQNSNPYPKRRFYGSRTRK